jgi:protein TonB
MTQPDPSRIDPVTATASMAASRDTTSPTDDSNAVSDDIAGAPGGGEGGGGGTGPGDGGGGGGNGEEILTPGGDVRPPVVLDRVEPDYPESARRARLQGTVILEATITTSGEVQQVRVLKSVNPLLDEAAVRAVRVWRYRPATLNGRAVPVYLTVTVRFGIDG